MPKLNKIIPFIVGYSTATILNSNLYHNHAKKSDLGGLNQNEAQRKLASIQRVNQLKPIKGADRIELAIINGWQCIVTKGEFKEGDLGVYFEIDSLLPVEEQYEFLRPSSYRAATIYNPAGFRLKTLKMRKQISQGLIIPLSVVEHKLGDLSQYKEGDDVTDKLNVKKWQIKESKSDLGHGIGGYTPYSNKTDEARIQSNIERLDILKGHPYFSTVKYDGSSMTIQYIDGELTAYSRSLQLARPNKGYQAWIDIILENARIKKQSNKNQLKSLIWETIDKMGIEEKLQNYGQNLILKGELIGPGIQKNKHKLNEHHWFCYTVETFNPETKKGERVNLNQFLKITSDLNIDTVDIEEIGEDFNETIASLLEKAKGQYESGHVREGLVYRPQYPEQFAEEFGYDFGFKIINNDFLLKEE